MGFASESQQAQSGVCWAVVSFQGSTGEGFTSELKCFQHGHWQSLEFCGCNPEASVSHRLSAGGCSQFLVTRASAEPARDGFLARWQSPSYITYRCEGSLVVFCWLQLSQRIDAFQLWCLCFHGKQNLQSLFPLMTLSHLHCFSHSRERP